MKKNLIVVLSILFLVSACTPFAIKEATFGWPIESVQKSDSFGKISEPRYAIEFNVKDLVKLETGSFTGFNEKEFRLIRDIMGYYYITSKSFKHVYVFNVSEGKLVLENKLLISENGISKPVFNQRAPHIELLDGDNKYLLSNKEVVRK